MMIRVFVFLTLAVAGYSAGVESSLDAFVKLDQAYIPALMSTGHDATLEKAVKMLGRLEKVWAEVRPALATRAAWSNAIAETDAALVESRRLLTVEKSQPKAHAALEIVRLTFMKARQKAGVSYPLDSLNRYHEVMEKLVLSRPADDESWQAVGVWLSEARREWQALSDDTTLPGLFGLDDKMTAEYRAALVKGSEMLAGLEKTVSDQNTKAYSGQAAQLKPLYKMVYLMFRG